MALRSGEILHNRYRIIKPLGQGGFGAVYRAEDLNLKVPCALKENLDYWDEALRQFEREALILAGLRHPNLPRVIDYFILPAQGQYLVMDFVEGYNLQEIIERVNQPLVEKQVLVWIDQICDALDYLHSQVPPVVHRDVKPSNIKVTPSGKAMLVDFGVAKRYNPELKTTEGARAVTAGFSPIEQYGEGTTDHHADIYALGATLYTLLTAKRPPESIDRATGAPLAPPRQLNSAISPHVEQTILRAMEMLAADRYSTVRALREALKKPAAVRPDQSQAVTPATASQRIVAGTQAPSTPISRPISAPISRPISAPVSRPISVPVSRPVSRPISQISDPSAREQAPEIDWVTIPAGEFLFGEEKRRQYLPKYQIARFPVSNQQYRDFLAFSPQVAAPAHWKEREYPMGKGRHPVVGVSYHDALVFCRWADCRLPSAQEWEKAARGTDGRTYPWGEDWVDAKYCNNWDTGIGGTTPVGKYLVGESPYGIQDMVGNVWEWTTSEHQGPLMHELCGGSWRSFSRFALRITVRDGMMLNDVRDDVGFRCARWP
jgi:serine/threonine protein kinase